MNPASHVVEHIIDWLLGTCEALLFSLNHQTTDVLLRPFALFNLLFAEERNVVNVLQHQLSFRFTPQSSVHQNLGSVLTHLAPDLDHILELRHIVKQANAVSNLLIRHVDKLLILQAACGFIAECTGGNNTTLLTKSGGLGTHISYFLLKLLVEPDQRLKTLSLKRSVCNLIASLFTQTVLGGKVAQSLGQSYKVGIVLNSFPLVQLFVVLEITLSQHQTGQGIAVNSLAGADIQQRTNLLFIG